MKMKTTIKGLALAFTIMFSSTVNAQRFVDNTPTVVSGFGLTSRDQDLSKLPKMDRDIVILQNVLNDLFKGSREGVFYSSRGAKGMYIAGKGVFFSINYGNSMEVIFADAAKANEEKDAEIDEKVLLKEKEDEIKSLSQDFLVNYGSILSELKDNEQVILNVNYSTGKGNSIRNTANGTVSYFTTSGKDNSKRMVSSISAKELKDFLSGKLSMEAATAKITSKVSADEDNEANDTKIMAGILDDVLQSTFDGTFRKNSRTTWTYFEGFGVMYEMSLFSDLKNRLAISYDRLSRTDKSEQDRRNEEKLNEEEAIYDKKIEENFEKLIDLAKESLVTYGRTLRSVKSDEVIILNMNFNTGFRQTSIPAAVRIQVNKSQIEAFSKGSISLEQLKKEIDIKRLSSSTNNSEVHYFPASPSEVFDVAPVRATGRVKGQN
ncbi:MAG: hypothetical protein COW03_05285 [Cytophagales bacterium CG12_big_fil_rev_8_21_14_0_65_40_12]|nr:MAG: hypothetical protein COW03_05285 [Cytophagales bacterium CG12_big_fil_rev_8_21_14_0_65_40_12]PIW05903.1 MAG: hypothetical protein COW40_02335 [Cytophagales bacterium CG17_big_fil_post_rev_8_21_14_2_50_40_13]